MAKGALTGERMAIQMMPEYSGQYTTEWPDHKTWTGPAAGNVVFNETYIDVSAYQLDDLTFFPMAAMLQDPGTYQADLTQPIHVLDIISDARLTISEVVDNMGDNNVPGMYESTMDFTQILWGQYRTFLAQDSFATGANVYLPANGGQFGSGSPTTAAKLYCTRIIITSGATEGQFLSIPASRFIVNAVVAEEEELAFLMRQKRSYELAQ